MRHVAEREAYEGADEGLPRAGGRVPAGRYVRADVPSGRVLVLEREDWLPASLDGRIAHYRRLPSVGVFREARAG